MKRIIVLILILLFSNFTFSQIEVNEFFFDLPLHLERNTIYSKIKELGFVEEKDNYIINQNDTLKKVFYGYLEESKAKLINLKLDTIKIQLTTASSSYENEKYYQNKLIISTYYYFHNFVEAKKYYEFQINGIENNIKVKAYHFENYKDGKKEGYSDVFSLVQNESQITISFEKERKEYLVKLKYERKEGEKQLKNIFRKEKQLIYKEFDKTKLYYLGIIDTNPITKRCQINNDKTINCFKNSLLIKLRRNIDFGDYLASGNYKIYLNFIIDSGSKILNINVRHDNKELVKKIKSSINQMEIISSGVKNGKNIDTYINLPIIITVP